MMRQPLANGHLFIGAMVALLCSTSFNTSSAQSQNRVIQLEVAAGERAEMTTQREWMEMLSGVGADRVRSRTSFGSAEVKIEEIEMGSSTVIVVSGVINGRKLILPGGRFGMKDVQAIRGYIQKLRDDGSKVALADKKAFGLTSEQLVGVHGELSAIVERPTRGESAAQVVKRILGLLKSPVAMDATANRALGGDTRVHDELKGLSAGTALAAAIRPLGLVVRPFREQGKPVEIRIVDVRSTEENWPVGWPIERPVNQVAPELMEYLNNIEIRNYPLNAILDRLEKRIGVPFLYDRNSMARAGIDLATAKVTLVKKKTQYMLALTKLLGQTNPKMKQEVRVDENGKAFLWITTLQ